MSKAAVPDAITFVCTQCERTHISPHSRAFPPFWREIKDDEAGDELLCPDCLASVPPLVSFGTIMCGFDPAAQDWDGGRDITPVAPSNEPPFAVHLGREPDGTFHVALSPGRILTLHQPLMFLIGADQAVQLADELHRYAALVRAPGTLGGAR